MLRYYLLINSLIHSLIHSHSGISFLKKHMKTKHEYFNYDGQIHLVEAHMKALYEGELVTNRPLPPIELEGIIYS